MKRLIFINILFVFTLVMTQQAFAQSDKVVVIPLSSGKGGPGDWKSVSVSSVGGVPALPTLETSVSVLSPGTCFIEEGGSIQPLGRYATSGGNGLIMVPVQLPDGASITSFTAHICDNSASVGGTMYLYRSVAETSGLIAQIGTGTTEKSTTMFKKTTTNIASGMDIVDNRNYSYFIFMQVNSAAGTDLLPISGIVTLQ